MMNFTNLRDSAFKAAAYVASRARKTSPARVLAWSAAAYLKGFENCSFDMTCNGERNVLERLRGFDISVFLDVGANHGDWTKLVLDTFPAAEVHAFEIAPRTSAILRQHVGDRERVRLNGFGLSNTAGNVTINYSPEADAGTSMIETQESARHATERVDARVETGDAYLEAAGISRVGFLKVDVEGAEPLVFAGFEKTFAARRIDCVQFEYGHARLSLREFYEFFETRGYRVGKIFPDCCDFGPYERIREFVVSNYVAVRADRSDLIDALS